MYICIYLQGVPHTTTTTTTITKLVEIASIMHSLVHDFRPWHESPRGTFVGTSLYIGLCSRVVDEIVGGMDGEESWNLAWRRNDGFVLQRPPIPIRRWFVQCMAEEGASNFLPATVHGVVGSGHLILSPAHGRGRCSDTGSMPSKRSDALSSSFV